MLPPGWSADAAAPARRAALRSLRPAAQTVAGLRIGGCACALLAGHGEDERHLRRRYAALGLPRSRIITALDRHRAGTNLEAQPSARCAELVGFVAEHARNAGPTVYLLEFGVGVGDDDPGFRAAARTIPVAAVLGGVGQWLEEGRPVEVTR
jgi:hypothetical protein